jgi:hypothetical protein
LPLAGSSLAMIGPFCTADAEICARNMTDQQRHFRLRRLRPANAPCSYKDVQDDYHDPEFLKSNEARGQHVRLDPGDDQSRSLRLIPPPSEDP